MATSFVGATTYIAGSGTSHTVNVPAGVQNDDLLLLFGSEDTNTPRVSTIGGQTPGTGTTPTNWNWVPISNMTANGHFVEGTFQVLVGAWKIASNEPASYAIVSSASWNGTYHLLAYRETHLTTPIDICTGIVQASNATHTTASITPSANNSMLVAAWSADYTAASDYVVNSPMTERSGGHDTAAFCRMEVGDDLLATAAAVTRTATFQVGGVNTAFAGASLFLALKPGTAAPAAPLKYFYIPQHRQ